MPPSIFWNSGIVELDDCGPRRRIAAENFGKLFSRRGHDDDAKPRKGEGRNVE
jgi:hypothetical protein